MKQNTFVSIVIVLSLFFCCYETNQIKYKDGENINFYVNTIHPFRNPSEKYEYYILPFCKPDKIKTLSLSLGQNLEGDRLKSSIYSFPFKESFQSRVACVKQLNRRDLRKFINAIKNMYYFDMRYDDFQKMKGFIGTTDQIGIDERGKPISNHFLFTHLHFTFLYNEKNIIFGNVTAEISKLENLSQMRELISDNENVDSVEIEFTYSANWIETDVEWKDRAVYQEENIQEGEIHWLSLLNSFVLALLLVGIIAIILLRILKNDYIRFSKQDEEEMNDEEDYGWKLIHGDVFRFPPYKLWLCSFLGVGGQLIAVCISVLLLAIIGVLYPEQKGSLYTAGIFLYSLSSIIGGSVSTSFYKKLNGENWSRTVIGVLFVFFGPVVIVYFLSSVSAAIYHSTAGFRFFTVFKITSVWLFITFPLTLLGSILAKRFTGEFNAPVRTKKVARELPKLPWYRSVYIQVIIAGLLPFSSIYIELYYIYSSIWGLYSYHVYGILFILFLILLIVTACITITLTYFQLSSEDYQWWWRSFISGGSTGIFIFIYSFYYFSHSHMNGLFQTIKFFGFVSLLCYFMFVMLGTVGFFSSLIFVKNIYARLKVA